MEDSTVKVGLLLEAAESHQATAAEALERLRQHAAGLDGVVREEIRATLVEELQDLQRHSQLAVESLCSLARHANLRAIVFGGVLVLLASAVPFVVAWWLLPSATEVAALRASRDQLRADVAQLRREGGAVDLKYCGPQRRLCARMDRAAPRYGETADYMVLKGY
jgi:hypothetical protein